MTSIIEALDKTISTSWWVTHPSWKQYVLTGDAQDLAKLPTFSSGGILPEELLRALPLPDDLDEGARRFLHGCIVSKHPTALGQWLAQCSAQDDDRAEQLVKGCDLLLSLGCELPVLAEQLAMRVVRFRNADGSPTVSWKFLLRLDDTQVRRLLITFASATQQWIDRQGAVNRLRELVLLFATHAPSRWKAILGTFNDDADQPQLPSMVWVTSLTASAEFIEHAAVAFALMKNPAGRFEVGAKLAEVDPARFGSMMEAHALANVTSIVPETMGADWGNIAAAWLATNRAQSSMPALITFMATPPSRDNWRGQTMANVKNPVLDAAIASVGHSAIPLLDAAFETEQPLVQLHAFQHWGTIKREEDTERVVVVLRHLLAGKDSATVSRAIRLAGGMGMDAFEPDLWAQFAHKSKPVREAAAVTMAQLGDSRLPKAMELWKAKRADTRLAAVDWLKTLGTSGAMVALESRLDDEQDDNVRDAILLALEEKGVGTNTDPSRLRARMEKTLAKANGAPVSWLDHTKLPQAKLKDGSPLSADSLLYLLHRQSRVKEMRADIEARPLFQQIDRTTSGDLALAVLQAFLNSDTNADDRWAMAFAAIIGDDRLVPLLARKVKDWADGMRGKLAEYGVQALALLGTDSALVAVDATSIRYRTKNRNIGVAASDAFALAAESRGLTVDELGDLVVPWLGFEPGVERIVDTTKARIAVRVGNDFKLAFRDVATNKKVAKLPAGASAEVQTELKELAAGLKEVTALQLLRMENLVVRQFRWPVAVWKELYLQHPLLIPFSQRLVWGAYDAAGQLTGTFRALEDHTTTGADDEPYAIPDGSSIGIVHPLELTIDERQRWITHLADYDVVPPFAQLERPVVTASDDQREVRFGNQSAGTQLNAMTFKGRAERLGWSRGSVCDGGTIGHYQKRFPAAGVDVFVELVGMYVGVGTDSDLALQRTFFVKHGSVKIGSYVYDEPTDASDPRLVAYGDVPPIAFSETMSDLAKIAGTPNGAA